MNIPNTPPPIRVGSAAIVLDWEGRVLLGVRAKEPNRGKWVLPGGKVEPFETLAEAVAREVLEETTIKIKVGEVATLREIIVPPSEHRLIVFHWARALSSIPTAASDLSEVGLFTPAETRQLSLSDVVESVLLEVGFLKSS